MHFAELPSTAAWRHRGARDGFEVAFLRRTENGYRFDGHAVAVEDADTWAVRYSMLLDPGWLTRHVWVAGQFTKGESERTLETNGDGIWRVDGKAARQLDGCVDVDLEASALTNALPRHRLGLNVAESAEAPAAYVRAADLRVERLEQSYARLADDGENARYDYAAPDLEFEAVLTYDRFGLILDYPGIAVRVA